jgi:hypothetical protein
MIVTTQPRRVRVAAAARHLDVGRMTVRNLFDQGALTGIRSDKGYRLIDVESLLRYQRGE